MTTAADLAATARARLAARLATARAADVLAEKLDQASVLATWVASVRRDPSTRLIVEVELSPATGGDGWRLTPQRVDGLIDSFEISRQPEEA